MRWPFLRVTHHFVSMQRSIAKSRKNSVPVFFFIFSFCLVVIKHLSMSEIVLSLSWQPQHRTKFGEQKLHKFLDMQFVRWQAQHDTHMVSLHSHQFEMAGAKRERPNRVDRIKWIESSCASADEANPFLAPVSINCIVLSVFWTEIITPKLIDRLHCPAGHLRQPHSSANITCAFHTHTTSKPTAICKLHLCLRSNCPGCVRRR